MISWHILNSSETLDDLIAVSMGQDVLIFKHSTSCSISYIAKSRLEDQWNFNNEELQPYYLDLKTYRDLSNAVAERFSIHHESPQVLVIRQAQCTFHASHLDISVADLREVTDQHSHA